VLIPSESGGGPARRQQIRRYGVSVSLSLLLHLLLGLLLLPWASDAAITAEPETVEVPLSFESLPEPSPPVPPPTQAPNPEPPPEAEAEPEETQPPPDDSLLGFYSEGEIPAEPDRPVGPEAEIKAPPPPGGEDDPVEPADAVEEETEPAAEPVEAQESPPGTSPDLEQAESARDPGRARSEPEPLGETPRAEAGDASPPSRLDVPPPVRIRPETPPPRRSPSGPEGPGSSLDYDVDVHGGLFGDLNFDSRDYNWSDYSVKVYFAVYRAWLRELLARARRFEREQKLDGMPRLEGEVAIHFVINRDGSVSDLEVVASTDLATLDEASSSALRRAVLPALPADFPRQAEGVTFRFILGVDNALQMERQLRYLQSRGQF
jgi:TonB family protein